MQHTVALAPVRTSTPARRAASARSRQTPAMYVWTLRHKRTLATVAIVALILASVLVAVASIMLRPTAPSPAGWAHVTVEPNASLWTLAAAHPTAGLSTSETARLIAEENSLDTGVIHPGQTIRVPASGLTDTAVALR